MRFLLTDVWAEHGRTASVGPHSVRYFNPNRYLPPGVYPTAAYLVDLHRSGDPSMRDMLAAFRRELREFAAEGIVAYQNPFPPEWLVEHAAGVVRVLGCFDDPQRTYSATLPVAWAYHGAFYCSPSYSSSVRFADALRTFGIQASHWFPLSTTEPSDELKSLVEASWDRRRPRALYVGRWYKDKLDRLARFNRGVGGELVVRGAGWPLRGFGGFTAPLLGRGFLPKWVRPVDVAERRALYLSSLVGLNLHLADGSETGNMRMYETTMHGALLLCDVAGCNAHADIFRPDVEAVFYRTIDEAVDKCLFYFRNPDQAIAIAQRGFQRACRDYGPDKVLTALLDWTAGLAPRAGDTAPSVGRLGPDAQV